MPKELKANVTLNVKKAERELDKLYKLLNKVDKLSQKAGGNDKLVNTIHKAEQKSEKLKNTLDKVANSTEKINNNFRKTHSIVDTLTSKIRRLAATYLGVMGAKAFITTADQITGAENKLNYLNRQYTGGDEAAAQAMTQETMSKIYSTAQGARTGYMDMVSNVSKSMVLAGKSFENNVDNAIRFQDIMAKAYTVGGASAAEQASSMYQMIQALGANTLQGDELRSVREGAPLAYKAIEQFAQGVYNTDESLKELASQGKITSDIVVAAMMAAGDEIDEAFSHTATTFAQTWMKIKNAATEAFRPAMEQMNAFLNSEAGQNFLNGIIIAVTLIAKTISVLFKLIAGIVSFINKHKKLILAILLSIAVVMAVVLFPQLIAWINQLIAITIKYTILGKKAIVSAIKTAAAWMIANWPLTILMAILIAIIIILVKVSDSFEDACGKIAGVVWVLVQFVWNLIKTIALVISNIIILIIGWVTNAGRTIANIAEGLWGVIKAIAHNIGAAFKNGFLEAKASAWDFVANACSAILKVANLINKVLGVFGIEIDTSTLENAINNARSKAETNRNNKATYQNIGDAFNSSKGDRQMWDTMGKIESVNNKLNPFGEGWASNAYNAGYNAGNNFGTNIKNALSGIGDKLTGLTGTDLNVDDYSGVLGDINNGIGDVGNNTGKTAGDTGSIKNTLKLSEEDLAYLRKVAEMEWKKEFTTANINIAMTNNNTLNSDADLDGIVTKLTEKLYEELDSVAAGVYS